MKSKGLDDLFEKDDWLAQQRIRESRISFWDLDDAKKVRMEHEQDCDVRETANMHHQAHLRRKNVDYSSTGENVKGKSGFVALRKPSHAKTAA